MSYFPGNPLSQTYYTLERTIHRTNSEIRRRLEQVPETKPFTICKKPPFMQYGERFPVAQGFCH
jgi:hypothetical protein